MTEPRPLSPAARTIVQTVRDLEEQDLADSLAIAAALGRGDVMTALTLNERIAERNLGTFKALTFLDADHFGKAQDALVDARVRLKKRQ